MAYYQQMPNHQRKDATSNTQAGAEFETLARDYFIRQENLTLTPGFALDVGVGEAKKSHRFDLGNATTLVECKSYRWTESGGVPHAKIKSLTEAMYYFHLAPAHYRKVLFLLKDERQKKDAVETLGEYYAKSQPHFIPDGVTILEFDPETQTATEVN